MATPADALARLLEILNRAEIQYSIGGSVASSTHGIPRTTMDVDLVAEIKPDQVDELVALLEVEFYADAAMIREALARDRSFNLIHYATAYKFDVFPLRQDDYSRTEFGRRARPPRTRSSASRNGTGREAKPPSANGAIFAASSKSAASAWISPTCATGPLTSKSTTC
jgi:hypothetical protein